MCVWLVGPPEDFTLVFTSAATKTDMQACNLVGCMPESMHQVRRADARLQAKAHVCRNNGEATTSQTAGGRA